MFKSGKSNTASQVTNLANIFRNAIEAALNKGEFENDFVMSRFPHGCCGDASELLAEYLSQHGIDNLWYVCGTYYPDTGDEEYDFYNKQSHAWISIGDANGRYNLIVDITGDQFKNKREYGFYSKKTYVGKMDGFHSMFDECDCLRIYGYTRSVNQVDRMRELYNKILMYI